MDARPAWMRRDRASKNDDGGSAALLLDDDVHAGAHLDGVTGRRGRATQGIQPGQFLECPSSRLRSRLKLVPYRTARRSGWACALYTRYSAPSVVDAVDAAFELQLGSRGRPQASDSPSSSSAISAGLAGWRPEPFRSDGRKLSEMKPVRDQVLATACPCSTMTLRLRTRTRTRKTRTNRMSGVAWASGITFVHPLSTGCWMVRPRTGVRTCAPLRTRCRSPNGPRTAARVPRQDRCSAPRESQEKEIGGDVAEQRGW